MKSLRIFIADHINFIHKLISYFVVFGCLLPIKYLILHLGFIVLLYTHWYLNDNYCFFSISKIVPGNVIGMMFKLRKNYFISFINEFISI